MQDITLFKYIYSPKIVIGFIPFQIIPSKLAPILPYYWLAFIKEMASWLLKKPHLHFTGTIFHEEFALEKSSIFAIIGIIWGSFKYIRFHQNLLILKGRLGTSIKLYKSFLWDSNDYPGLWVTTIKSYYNLLSPAFTHPKWEIYLACECLEYSMHWFMFLHWVELMS